jgi:hypothetical protein
VGLLDRIAARKSVPEGRPSEDVVVEEPVFSTKALHKFLSYVAARESPVVLDLGPVVQGNIDVFCELGCKVIIEDLYDDVERHLREFRGEELPQFFERRFPQETASVDGVLCWDLIDYLDRPVAEVLAAQLMRVMRPQGVLLGLFGTARPRDAHYTKYVVVDDSNLKYRTYPATRGRQAILLNRDIIRLFGDLRVSDSFLLQNNLREILFRKPW